MKARHVVLWLLLTGVSNVFANPVDEAAIRSLFQEQFRSHWEAADPQGLAALWVDDGDWMSLIGSRKVFEGRDQIEQVWSIGLQGRDTPEKRNLEIEVDSIKALSPDLAQVDLVMTFGHIQTGIVREAMTAVVEGNRGEWKIASCRVARISATSAQH